MFDTTNNSVVIGILVIVVVALLLIMIYRNRETSSSGFTGDHTKVGEIVRAGNRPIEQPVPVVENEKDHEIRTYHPESVAQSELIQNVTIFQGVDPHSAGVLAISPAFDSVGPITPDQDWNDYIIINNLDSRIIDNQKRWAHEVAPWSRVTFTPDTDLNMDVAPDFRGLRFPQPIPTGDNMLFITAVDKKDLSTNAKYDFAPNVLTPALAAAGQQSIYDAAKAVQIKKQLALTGPIPTTSAGTTPTMSDTEQAILSSLK